MALDDFKNKITTFKVVDAVCLLAEQTYDNAKIVTMKHLRGA
jgi:hypothetical protein